MVNKIVALFLCIALCSIQHIYSAENQDDLFRVIKIKTKRDYYIIHTKRNDILFKIISKKMQLDIPNLELLKKGNYYYFDIGINSKKATEDNIEALTGIANYLDVKNKPVFVDGNTKIRFTKRFHFRLYTTKNLIGLFYIPDPPDE